MTRLLRQRCDGMKALMVFAVRTPALPLIRPAIFRHRCPLDVLRLVMAVRVNPIQCPSSAWALAHVSQEISEIIPSPTDRYASVLVGPSVFGHSAGAAPAHGYPTLVGHRLAAMLRGVSMLCPPFIQRRQVLGCGATATYCASVPKIEAENKRRFAAVAYALIAPVMALVGHLTEHGQSSEPLSNHGHRPRLRHCSKSNPPIAFLLRYCIHNV